jgi:hypothetical protein
MLLVHKIKIKRLIVSAAYSFIGFREIYSKASKQSSFSTLPHPSIHRLA